MEIKSARVEMTCTLELTEQEATMLEHLSGFGRDLGKIITERLTGKYAAEQWDELFASLRMEACRIVHRMRDTRAVFSGERVAELPKVRAGEEP